jgi:Spy/CpxP family protein refolding chaperone
MKSFRNPTAWLCATALALALAGPGAAEPRGHGGPPDVATQVERMSDELGLDAGQQEALRAVLEEQRAAFETLREQARSEGRSPELRSAFRDTFRETQERIEALLTPEQVEAFRNMRADRRHGHRRHKGDCDSDDSETS